MLFSTINYKLKYLLLNVKLRTNQRYFRYTNISWLSVLLVEEAAVHRETHEHVASYWQA